jgi:predicted lipid-binding transport protein (Tim44 family)
MSPPPTIYTPPSELDGTIAGMIVLAVVAALALMLLLGLVYWANNHPTPRKPKAQRPGKAHQPAPTASPRNIVPGHGKPGSGPPRASAASSAAQAPDPEPAASRLADGPHHRE